MAKIFSRLNWTIEKYAWIGKIDLSNEIILTSRQNKQITRATSPKYWSTNQSLVSFPRISIFYELLQ